MRVGILSIQGGFDAHAAMLQRLNTPYSFVTHPKHLSGLQGLIIPGGESSTMLKFLAEDNFLSAIKQFASENRPIFGTCAGAILLAREVLNPQQVSLGLIDITVERNSFGRQLSSHIGWGHFLDRPMEMVFIRSPRITRVGVDAKILATYQGDTVAVQQDNCLITTFHPELTQDTTLHQLFINALSSR